MPRWSPDDIPDLSGRVAVVTGANGGLGGPITRVLADRGARVVMACRDTEKARRVRGDRPAEIRPLDLADLASVRAFAADLPYERIDLLVNNAGVMAVPQRRTADGFELQFGTNHLGHFALTGLLLPRLRRVVTVTSVLRHLDRVPASRRYHRWLAYGATKQANLLFARELDRRYRPRILSVAAHPGYAATDLQLVGPRMSGSRLQEAGAALLNRLVAQPAAMGALPILYAATMPGVGGGELYAPGGLGIRGLPRRVRAGDDPAAAARLWDRSEELTGVTYGKLG